MSYIHAGEPVPFKSAILIETVFLPEDIGIKVVGRYRPVVEARPWRWNTIDEAKDFIHNYPAWKKWHKEIRHIHLVSYPTTLSGLPISLVDSRNMLWFMR